MPSKRAVRRKARGEVEASLRRFHQAAGLALQANGDILPDAKPGKLTLLERLPVGVVAAITPWNVPLVLAMRAVAPVTVVDTEEEALELTNCAQALVNAVYTGDELRGLAFAQRVRAGMVHVNDAMGRPTGESDLEELTTRRWIGVQRTPLEYPL